jgi:GxxExxY protein
MTQTLKRNDLLYPKLNYQIVGILFTVFNDLGYRYKEKYYQRAIAEELKSVGIPFQEQVHVPVRFKGKEIGHNILDFLIDRKVILEIKRGDAFSRGDIQQTNEYLHSTNLRLALPARFSSKGMKFRRIVNIK